MQYPPDAFVALVQEVESQGGALLPDPCTKGDITYTTPTYIIDKTFKGLTSGCGHETQLVTVYESKVKPRQPGTGFVTACAVCDHVGIWPRYSAAVYAVDPELNPSYWDEEEDETEEDDG